MSKNPHRAKYERNFSSSDYYANMDETPSLAEEAFYHQILVGAELTHALQNDTLIAALERRTREMFVLCSAALIECNPSDAGAFLDAQVNARAALKIMSMLDEIMTDAEKARTQMKISKDGEDLTNA